MCAASQARRKRPPRDGMDDDEWDFPVRPVAVLPSTAATPPAEPAPESAALEVRLPSTRRDLSAIESFDDRCAPPPLRHVALVNGYSASFYHREIPPMEKPTAGLADEKTLIILTPLVRGPPGPVNAPLTLMHRLHEKQRSDTFIWHVRSDTF